MSTDVEKLRDADMTRFHFSRLSMQYYAIGRAAALQNQMAIMGNLLHHAVEMALKAALSYQVELQKMKKSLSHHLPKIWEKFLALNPHLDGAEHAGSIERLHAFEELRYPDSMIANDWTIQFCKFRYEVGYMPARNMCVRGHSYLLVLEDVDSLMAFIFKAAGLSLEESVEFRSSELMDMLTKDNRHWPKK